LGLSDVDEKKSVFDIESKPMYRVLPRVRWQKTREDEAAEGFEDQKDIQYKDVDPLANLEKYFNGIQFPFRQEVVDLDRVTPIVGMHIISRRLKEKVDIRHRKSIDEKYSQISTRGRKTTQKKIIHRKTPQKISRFPEFSFSRNAKRGDIGATQTTFSQSFKQPRPSTGFRAYFAPLGAGEDGGGGGGRGVESMVARSDTVLGYQPWNEMRGRRKKRMKVLLHPLEPKMYVLHLPMHSSSVLILMTKQPNLFLPCPIHFCP
jgi:hypothetical protein